MIDKMLPEGAVVTTPLGLTVRRDGVITTLRVEAHEGVGRVVVETRSAHAPDDPALLMGLSMTLDPTSLQGFAVDVMAMAAQLRAGAALDAVDAERRGRR